MLEAQPEAACDILTDTRKNGHLKLTRRFSTSPSFSLTPAVKNLLGKSVRV